MIIIADANSCIQNIYNYLSLWPGLPGPLVLGMPKKVAPSASLEPLPGDSPEAVYDDGTQKNAQSCNLWFRLRGGAGEALALCDSLSDYIIASPPPAPQNGERAALEAGRSAMVRAPNSDGSRDFYIKLRYSWLSRSGEEQAEADKYPVFELDCSGKRFVIKRGGPFRLISASGLEAAEYTVKTAGRALSDGSFILGRNAPKREITLKFGFALDNYTAMRREYLISLLSPSADCVLSVKRGSARRKIGCAVGGSLFNENGAAALTEVSLKLVCPDPYFYDAEPYIVRMRTVVPLFSAPFTFMRGAGAAAGVRRAAYDIQINNTGHAPAGIVADLYASSGEVTNPRIACNGSYVKLADVLDTGDTYRISTAEGGRYVKKNGSEVFTFDRRSVFFVLPPGKNIVSVSAEAGGASLDAKIECSFRYFGV